MKKYTTDKSNELLREAVKKWEDYCMVNISCSRSYMNNEEYTWEIAKICNISYGMAKKVCWITRGDGYRDEIALKIFGYNKHTA